MSAKKSTNWIFSNQPLSKEDWCGQVKWKGIHYGKTETFASEVDVGTIVVLDGYMVPRIGNDNIAIPIINGKIPFSDASELSRSLKGRFVIAWTEREGIVLCTDHHGMAKCFFAQVGERWWISNNLPSLIKVLDPGPDPTGVALFNLFEHFVGGRTLFADIRCSEPAAVFRMSERKLAWSPHWQPLRFVDNPKINTDMMEWRDFWKNLINGYVNGLNSKKASLTLTGGNDSRLVLAGLLALGITPDSFTFGNPMSHDSVVSAEISKKIGSNHHCHFVEQPSSPWFRSCSDEIISKGNGLINVHRSHRLDAIKKETAGNNNDILFTGFMGGDYLKGLSYDDYITAKFMRLWAKGTGNKFNYFESVIQEKHLQFSAAQKDCLWNVALPALDFLEGSLSLPVREIVYLFQVIGGMHDYQDATVFSWGIPNVINPYMDVDFLERLWSSPYSSLGGGNIRHAKGSASRVYFSCKLTHLLAPELSHIPYAKRGAYSAWELLNQPKTFRLKRVIRHLLKKDRYISNFPYGKWFDQFCQEELGKIHPEVESFYDMKQLRQRVNEMPEMNNEREWHFATNPINLSMNYRFLKGKQL